MTYAEEERPTGGPQSNKRSKSFSSTPWVLQVGKWFPKGAFFRGPWALEQEWGLPILEGSQSCGGASSSPGGRAWGPGQPAVSPLGELASPHHPALLCDDSVLTVSVVAGVAKSRSDWKQ